MKPEDLLPVVPAVVGAIGGIFDSKNQSDTAKRNTDKTIKHQKEEAELAYKRQLEMWRMQNEYNSPQSQMQRYQAAGLNPHLIYGQGSSGNASSPPAYQPPNIQYRYAAPAYGAAAQTLVPTLMSVASWMQDMRAKDAEIRQTQTMTEKAEQAMGYLEGAYPQQLRALENKNELFPYQRSIIEGNKFAIMQKLRGVDEEFRYQYGDALYNHYQRTGEMPFSHSNLPGTGGKKGDELRLLQIEIFKRDLQRQVLESERKLKEAQASWTDYDITNPQAIMQLVASGILKQAGVTVPKPRGMSVNSKTRSRADADFNNTTKRFQDFTKRRY